MSGLPDAVLDINIMRPTAAHREILAASQAEDGGEAGWAAAPGCCARVVLEFCQRPEWLRPGAALIVRDRGDNCVSGAGVVRRLLPRAPARD
jgi:hypothetical protein